MPLNSALPFETWLLPHWKINEKCTLLFSGLSPLYYFMMTEALVNLVKIWVHGKISNNTNHLHCHTSIHSMHLKREKYFSLQDNRVVQVTTVCILDLTDWVKEQSTSLHEKLCSSLHSIYMTGIEWERLSEQAIGPFVYLISGTLLLPLPLIVDMC